MRTFSQTLRAFALAGIFASTLQAQPSWQKQPVLKPVDGGVADIGPLATQGRIVSKDVRQPSQFDRVYEVEMNGQKYFARANGAVTAIFPRAAYALINGRMTPIVPGGTTFYLGRLPDNAIPVESDHSQPANSAARSALLSDGARPMNNWINLSAAGAVPDRQSANMFLAAPAAEVSPPTANLWESESYRITRTAQLIDAAKKVRKGRVLSSPQ